MSDINHIEIKLIITYFDPLMWHRITYYKIKNIEKYIFEIKWCSKSRQDEG